MRKLKNEKIKSDKSLVKLSSDSSVSNDFSVKAYEGVSAIYYGTRSSIKSIFDTISGKRRILKVCSQTDTAFSFDLDLAWGDTQYNVTRGCFLGTIALAAILDCNSTLSNKDIFIISAMGGISMLLTGLQAGSIYQAGKIKSRKLKQIQHRDYLHD